MPKHDLHGLLESAELRVRGARALLARPRVCNLEACVTLFREAQGYLEWVRDSLPEAGYAGGGLRRQAIDLAGEIRQTGVLLDHAERFGRRWLERLRSMSSGYTVAGVRDPLRVRGRISLLG